MRKSIITALPIGFMALGGCAKVRYPDAPQLVSSMRSQVSQSAFRVNNN